MDTDKLLRRFTTECMSSPETCDLAQDNTTSTELEAQIYDLIEKLKYNPVFYQEDIINYGVVKKLVIYNTLYRPKDWKLLATVLAGLMKGDFTGLDALLGVSKSTPPPSTRRP